MGTQTVPYITFPGNAAEAFEFYRQVFGGELHLMRYDDQPMDLPFTPPPGAVAHAQLNGDQLTLAGGDDVAENPAPLSGGPFSLLLNSEDLDHARDLRDKLLEGGTEAMPFDRAPWGDYYGQVTDKFGVLWQINVTNQTQEA